MNSISAGPQLVGGQCLTAPIAISITTAVHGNTHQSLSAKRLTRAIPGTKQMSENRNQYG